MWCGSKSFEKLEGAEAVLLVAVLYPHHLALIGVQQGGRKTLFRCENCYRVKTEFRWRVSKDMRVEHLGTNHSRVVDESAGLLIDCAAVGDLDVESEVSEWLADWPFVRDLVERDW